MISLIETFNYSCLNKIRQSLSSFNVLVGPNAGGKTTFLDVVSFISDLVSHGLETAVHKRTANFYDLVWKRSGRHFELAIEAALPDHILRQPAYQPYGQIRYEISVGINEHEELSVLSEKGLLIPKQRENYTESESIITSDDYGCCIFRKTPEGNAEYSSEVCPTREDRKPLFRPGPRKSVLGNFPEDESLFPASTWLRNLLINGVQYFVLNSLLIRKASPPGQMRRFMPDGSNLPWVIARLKEKNAERFYDWIAHLQTALPDIEDILIKEREDDRHRYLLIRYRSGTEIPSWMVSDGTLRLLALTLPAYLIDFEGIYLIEEPENGIHPCAVETVVQSLSSVYNAQILLATHSPVILSAVSPEAVLCFAKDEEGASNVVSGTGHPQLRDWKGEENIGLLYAAGVLG